MTADLVIHDIEYLFTCRGPAPRIGGAQADAGLVRRAIVAGRSGRILYAGPSSGWNRAAEGPACVRIDGRGCTVLPGLVDPHTHAIYAGDRRDELMRRLAGVTYAEIAAAGGGIVSTVRATRAASETALVDQTRPRLDEMLAAGTTTAEVKSGYGLDLDTELRLLRAIRRLDREHPMDLVPTFMGAHEIPEELRADRRTYVDLVVNRMIPEVAAEGLAEWCDVFCEAGVFTPAEATEILTAGRLHGLQPRIHADELGRSGGSGVAAAVGARSADHLLFAGPPEIEALAGAGVVATLLPLAALYLKQGRFGPARALLARGVPVALATDLNPGAGLSASMIAGITLACFGMSMTLDEALVAATINAAYAINCDDRVGSLEAGKLLDAVVVPGHPVDLLRIGHNPVALVVKRGAVVVDRRKETSRVG